MPKKEITLKEIKENYWTCADCATKAGGVWPKGHVCTVQSGDCKHCGLPGTLIPWVDFNWPLSERDDRAAKVTRD